MKMKELKLKSKNELQHLLVESREKMREMRFKISQRQLKNIREMREIKKTIARILTLLNEKKNLED